MTDKPLWEVETEVYMPRISVALDIMNAAEPTTLGIPRGPFETPLTEEQYLAYQLMLFGRNTFLVIDQLFDNVGLLWSKGRMVGVSSLVRFAMEYWAAAHFGVNILEDYAADKDIAKAIERCIRLTASAKTPVLLPWGGETSVVAYSVMKFVDLLEQSHPGTRATYDFLSEATHPNFLQNFYFIMASRRYENFSNEMFKKHARELMDKTIQSVEMTAQGIAEELPKLMKFALPLFGGAS